MQLRRDDGWEQTIGIYAMKASQVPVEGHGSAHFLPVRREDLRAILDELRSLRELVGVAPWPTIPPPSRRPGECAICEGPCQALDGHQ